MKRCQILVLVLCLVSGSDAGAEVTKKVRPTAYSFNFHGNEHIGEIDAYDNFMAGSYNKMDPVEPTEPAPKSLGFELGTVARRDCAGARLQAVWTGRVTGRIVGELRVAFHTVSGPRTVDVRIWPDIRKPMCKPPLIDRYPTPVAERSVELAPGLRPTEVVFEGVAFVVKRSPMVQITPQAVNAPGRIIYDSPEFAPRVDFSCAPIGGANTCL